ncbi:MAG TPA: response regulator transcription factor [Terriglobales bacterium]|nr:response regulator transcription factor [Terriglobales bacterium]
MGKKRIVIADDHAEMLDEVRQLLENDYDIVAAVDDGAKLVDAAFEHKPDLVITDISMPVMNGFEAAAKLRGLGLKTDIIFLTVQSTPPYVRKARSLGANGYVLKVYANEQLPLAVSEVLSGGSYTSPQLNGTH